jgi:uncharacterized repeat protein (TIGR01451 family)
MLHRPRSAHPPRLAFLFALCLMTFCISLAGCFGVSQNPSYFPHLLPTGDIIRTHAKPPGPSYYANFDPHAVRLEVRPLIATDPVRTQHVLIATVYDEKGKPRRNRRVEWMLQGEGNIVEVDESGIFPGRGYKVDNHYAVSYTNYCEHRISRGNVNPGDDFVLRPGQTWCVITSAVEGDTYVTAYAPEIADWDKHKVFVTTHWVDAEWTFPPPASDRTGAQHVFTTQIVRHTDRQPLANYRVRYRILDGPPAVFLPSQTQEHVAISNLRGEASVTLAQVRPALGINHIGIEVIRPPDPSTPSGSGIVIGTGQTAMEWLAPDIRLKMDGPQTAAVAQDIPYTITVTNAGRAETRSMTVRNRVPPGLTFVSANPPPANPPPPDVRVDQLVWTFGMLPAGQVQTIQAVFRADRPGPMVNCATVDTEEGLHAEDCATTAITAPALRVDVAGPTNAVVGAPVAFQITVTNPGTGPAGNVILSADFDPALEHESRANPVELTIGTVGPNETRTVPLTLIARREGPAVLRVNARADGGLRARGQHEVMIQKAQMALAVAGPVWRYKSRPVDWEITVSNPGEVPLNNVIIRNRLPAEVTFVRATDGGQLVNGSVEWRIVTIGAKEQKKVTVTANCEQLTRAATTLTTAEADGGLTAQGQATLEIRGIPAFTFQVTPSSSLVEVGKRMSYRITVTNTGSLPGDKVVIKATIPPELKLVGQTGPSKETIAGGTITFAPVDNVQPEQTLTYDLEVEGVKGGDIRLRVDLSAATLRQPVVKEAPTTVYDPKEAPR